MEWCMTYDGSFDQGSSVILIGLPIAWLVSEWTVDHDCLCKWCDIDLGFRTCSWKGGKLLTCFGNPALCLHWFQNPLLEGGELSTMIAAGPGMECRDEFGKPMYRNRRSVSQVTLTLVWMLLFFVLFTWVLWKGWEMETRLGHGDLFQGAQEEWNMDDLLAGPWQ